MKQKKLPQAIANAINPPPEPSPEELAARQNIKEELHRMLELVDQGRFGGMIFTEITAEGQMATGLWGHRDIVEGSAMQIARAFMSNRVKEQPKQPAVVMPPEKKLILPENCHAEG